MRNLIAILSALLLSLAAHAAVLAAPPTIPTLSRGINIPHWWWLAQDATPEGRNKYISVNEFKALKDAGFTHVRVPFDPDLVYDHAANAVRPATVAELKATITLINKAGLAVVLDNHPMGTRAEWALADKQPEQWGAALEKFWATFAPQLTDTDPALVVIELLNEPFGIKDKAQWPRVQEKIFPVIRKACPKHTIMLTGDDYGGIDGLLRLTPVKDDNVVYSFHFYESHTFTHQSATWGAPFWKHIKDLPYPSTPEIVEPVAKAITDQQAAGAVRSYGKERWNAQKIAARIEQAAAWAKDHNAVVYCGEFGAIRSAAPPADRTAWLADVVKACEGRSIGRAMWDYAGGFALATGEAGKRTLDPQTLGAIVPAQKR